jgi:hypothetical protein
MLVRVVSNSNGHGSPIGSELYVASINGAYVYLSTSANDRGRNTGWSYQPVDLELCFSGRAEEADFLERRIAENQKIQDKLTAENKALKEDVVRLRKFKDDEEELATMLSETIKSGGDVAAIYKVVKKMGLKRKAS